MKKPSRFIAILIFILIYAFTVNSQTKDLTVNTSHFGSVSSVDFSANGNILVSGSSDNTIKVWDVKSGKLIRTIPAFHSYVTNVALSQDGEIIAATGYNSHDILLFNSQTGKLIRKLSGHSMEVNSIAISANSKFIVSASDDESIKLWNLDSGKLISSFTSESPIKSIAISNNNKLTLSASSDNALRLYNTATGKEISKVDSRAVECVSFSPDGKFFLCGNRDGSIEIFNSSDSKLIKSFQEEAGILSLNYSPNGKNIICASTDGNIMIVNSQTGEQLKSISENSAALIVKYSPSGKSFAVGGSDGELKLKNSVSGKTVKVFGKKIGLIPFVKFSSDGRNVSTLGDYEKLKIWDLKLGKMYNSSINSNEIKSFSFLPGNKIIWSSWDDTTRIVSLISGNSSEIISGDFSDESISSEGNTVATISKKGVVKIWSIKTGKELQSISGTNGSFFSVFLSKKKKFVAAGSDADTIRIWDVNTGKIINELKCSMYSFNFSPDENFILTSTNGDKVNVQKVTDNKIIRSFKGNVDNNCFSSDGKYLTTIDEQGIIYIWNFKSGKLINKFDDNLYSGHFSPNGKYFVSVCNNGNFILWDLTSGKKIRSLPTYFIRQDSYQNAYSFSANSDYIITRSDVYGKLNIYSTHNGDLVVSLIPIENKSWMVESPNGEYDCDEKIENDIYFVEGNKIIESSKELLKLKTPGLLKSLLNK